jgi:hypothetical protein
MSPLSRGAVLITTASLVAGFVAGPAAAYAADTTTSLSAAEMAAALRTAAGAWTQAAHDGVRATVDVTGDVTGSELIAVDPAAGVTYMRLSLGTEAMALYSVAGTGTYDYLSDPKSLTAVKMMHRPAVRYRFTADKSQKLDLQDLSPVSTDDDIDHAGTKTVHDDGSADYRLTDKDGTKMTVHVTAAGLLDAVDADGNGLHEAVAYTYGPQSLTLPPASATISAAALARGIAFLDMATWVKQVTRKTASDARRAAHGHRITVSALRTTARRDANTFNRAGDLPMLKAKNVPGGVRVYATNPWTRHTVSYTLKPSGRKVIVTTN